jgi:hypothetical protein
MIINLNIPDANATQLVDGICAATGWTVASGVTKAAWAKAQTATWIKETAKRGLLKESHASIATTIDPVNIT